MLCLNDREETTERCKGQKGSEDLQEGHSSVTKEVSSSAKHVLKVSFTKT